jgi:hypothetical protein
MTMYTRVTAVVVVALVVAGVGGFFLLKESAVGPITALDRARVTGYATSNLKGQTSGAVSVRLDGASAARLDQIVEGLPQANPEYICVENPQEYRISFTVDAGAGTRRGFGLTGYECGNLVVEVPSHGLSVERVDRDCALLRAVRRLLPASAIATHSGTCASASARLFVPVPRHRIVRQLTSEHGALRHGTLRRLNLRADMRADRRDVKAAVTAPTLG